MINKLLISFLTFAFFASANLYAKTLPFSLSISGDDFSINKDLELSDPGEGKDKINFDFTNKSGKKFNFDLKYKKLPSNRSYPTNLDVTIKDAEGNKRGYLFWANNGVDALKKTGVFGLKVNVDGRIMDIKFTFDANKKGELSVNDLSTERFISDTLIPKKGFQMIRPMILPETQKGVRSQSYALDAHPFEMNYTLKDINDGQVQFQYNLLSKKDDNKQLLECIYFNASNLEALREGMFAGKYFDKEYGAFKLVFYPAMGQTEPPK